MRTHPILVTTTLALLALAAPLQAHHVGDELDPADVRQLAVDAGLGSLRGVKVPKPSNLDDFLRPGDGAKRAAIQLGKALFWDMQVGSDGQACASCHYHAGVDARTKNQLSPGSKNLDPALRDVFDPMATGTGGPNYQLRPGDFPFRQLDDERDRSSLVLHDSDDVCSSQGVFNAMFEGIRRGRANDEGRPLPDAVFNVGGVNVRRVEPRNTPTVINAVFHFVNFWDGRAHAVFNGVNGAGPLDAGARILVRDGKSLVPRTIRIGNASLASQAVEPALSDLEMSFLDRPFPALARKLLSLRPLGRQLVHPKDSVLGSLSRARLDQGGALIGKPGLSVDYEDLIERAFESKYWDSSKRVGGYTQMEQNFALFFGLAIQMYESTLVSDRSHFDAFMEGQDDALTEVQMRGLLTFINRGPDLSPNPLFADFTQGNCVSCHAGPELTTAALTSRARKSKSPPLIEVAETPELIPELAVGTSTAYRDRGFANIGVRPVAEDPGRGGTLLGFPLSYARQRLLRLPFAPTTLPECGGPEQPVCPEHARVAVDGAFKVPGLRNVELTGPYFHNGGQGTLRQVVIFYERQGDFSDASVRDLDPDVVRVQILDDDERSLVQFMLSLTDERVRDEQRPFDHPQLFIPNGHPGNASFLDCVSGLQACDVLLEIPAVGEAGRQAIGLQPLKAFLAP